MHGAPEGGDGDGDKGDGGEAEEAPADETPADKTSAEEPARQQPSPAVASLARRAARRQPKTTRAGRSAAIKAAAHLPTVPHGHVFFTVPEVASAFDDKSTGFPRGWGS
ncbi:hypothetical protein ACIA8B_22865 [Micromonospora chalcea]